MSYAKKTFLDRNPVKRYFQRKRLQDALRLAGAAPQPAIIADFGAGDGELGRQLCERFPEAEIICYEPHPELLEQARAKLAGAARLMLSDNPDALPEGKVDLLFCLEVFEHLPEPEFSEAMARIGRALSAHGVAVVGVPVETGLPALYKGIFRMFRRFGEFDARPGAVGAAIIGRPPRPRPRVELLPGSYYHLDHLGFDHRRFRRRIEEEFRLLGTSASPVRWLGAWINSEVYFVVTKHSRV